MRKIIVAGILLFGLALLYQDLLVILLVGSFLIAFAMLPALLKRKMEGNLPIGAEFNTFGTVIMGAAFGPGIGAAYGLVITFFAAFVERAVNIGTPISFAIAALIGFLAQPLYNLVGLNWAGIILILLGNVLGNGFFMLFERDAEITTMAVVGSLFNLVVNYVVFAYFGSAILSVAKIRL